STAQTLVGHYVAALAMRRKAHQMGAIFGGKLPCSPVLVAGGATEAAAADKVTAFRQLLTELRTFINNTLIPDVLAVAGAFGQYAQIGKGPGNLLAYGVFDLDANGTSKLLARGRYTEGQLANVDTTQIKEYVKYSWYSSGSGLNPAAGVTRAAATKNGAYSWLKAPRYMDKVHEVGALARMWVNGDYRKGISVIDRHAARALEAKKIADAMDGWLNQLVVGQPSYSYVKTPSAATGIGLTEAPRGALGHWLEIKKSQISRYQIVTPTAWNASPMDDAGRHGAIEQALVGTPVADMTQPIEVLRVIHSFDPCLSCSVHMARPGRNAEVVVQA
ncbi:MAG: nickel-dependent hydrogenase large subunit, partial [Phycisphaerae bacterium]|nr:nickel-dependent hydrogenase large subunit [Phycisphaerae bacterium]